MSRHPIQESALALAWSLWSELGVPGLSRNHEHTVVDPEPLIVATPILAAADPRLLEQVLGWCLAHEDRVSASRLKGLLRTSSAPVVASFGALSAAVARHGVRWPAPSPNEAWREPARAAAPPLPVERPSMLRFRLRALCGVGARADLLCDLVSHSPAWMSAAGLARQGYTKRNVARILSELESAGIVRARRDGSAVLYQLVRPTLLAELAGGRSQAIPDWQTVFALILGLLALLGHESAPATVRRVEASAFRERQILASQLLGLETPPPTRGVSDAWDAVLEWGKSQARDIGAGVSPAFAAAAVPK